MQQHNFSLRERGKSFRHALRGLGLLLKYEHNARLHLVATVFVVFNMIIFKLTGFEILLLGMVTFLVWIAEIINTCIEKAMDVITKERHPLIRNIKDLSATAVLLSSILALLAGIYVLSPKYYELLSSL